MRFQTYFNLVTQAVRALLCVFTVVSSSPLWAADSKPEKNVDLQAYYAKAFGSDSAAKIKIPSQLDLALQIQKKEIASIKAYSDNGAEITHVEAIRFFSLIESYIKADYFQGLHQKSSSKQRLSLADLKAEGVVLEFDQNALSLKLLIPTEMRVPIKLTVGRARRKTSYPTDSELAKPANISGYINFNANTEHDYTTDSTAERLAIEAVANVKGGVLESQHTWRNDRPDELTRTSTRLSFDRQEQLQRITVGDINTEYRNYQQGVHLGGVKVEKLLGLDPYLETRSASRQRFRLEQDSEVKIYVNDFYKDKKQLDAGEYTLTDLDLETGANTIRLEITDDEGNTSEQRFSLLNDRRLLQSGLSTYALEVGKPAYTLSNQYEYDSDATVMSGYYRQGIAGKLTAGTSFVSDGNNTQLGGDVFVPTPIGGITGKLSVVKEKDENMTHAAGFHYQYSVASAEKKKQIQLSLSGDYFDEGFAALGYASNEDKLQAADSNVRKTRANASVGKALGKKVYGSLNIQRETFYDNNDVNYSASANVRKTFENGNSLSTRLRYRNDSEQDKSLDMRLHVPLSKDTPDSRYKTFDTTYNSVDSSIVSTFFVGPKRNTGKDSLAGAITHYAREASNSINANVSYRGNYAEVAASHSISKARNGSQSLQQKSKFKLKTALSFADGQFALSKPIRGGFAMVTGPDNQDKAIAVTKGRSSFTRTQGNDLPDNYQAVISKVGMPAVINLPSYRYNSVNIDSTALPNGSDPDQTEFEVKPSYRRGYLLSAGGVPGVTVDGKLLDTKGEPLALVGGQFIASDPESKPIDFFTNSAGRFRLISVPPADYTLELFSEEWLVKRLIQIPNKVGEMHDLGEISVSSLNG